jgi:hypothetical protein
MASIRDRRGINVAKLDQFFDAYERTLPAWSGDAFAAVLLLAILVVVLI